MIVTIEGIYKNGRVELEETPDNLHEARVLVTFLPDEFAAPINDAKTAKSIDRHLKGKYAFVPTSSDAFAARKQQEIQREH